MRATGKGPATTSSHTPPVSGKSWNATASSPSGASCTWSIRRTRPWTSPTRFTKSFTHILHNYKCFVARQNALSLPPLLQPPPAAQPGRGHDSHQKPPHHQAVHTRQAGQMGHQELPAVRGQDRLHSRRRNLHGPGQEQPLAPPRISRQCCPPSRGELAGHQQEPHAVHGPLLQLRRALPHAEERAGSPGRGHRHAKPQALPQGTRQEADRTWPVRIPVPGSSVCHRLEGPQAHPLPEQLPRPEESVHREQACGGPARAVDHATACGGLHQVSLPPVSFHTVLHECSACTLTLTLVSGTWEPWTRTTRSHA